MSLQVAEQSVNSTGRLPADRPHVLKVFGETPLGSRLTPWDLSLRATLRPWFLGDGRSRIIADLMHVGNPRRVVRVAQFFIVGVDTAGKEIRNPNYGNPILHQPPMRLRLGVEHSF